MASRGDNCIIRESVAIGLPPSGFAIAYADRLTSHERSSIPVNKSNRARCSLDRPLGYRANVELRVTNSHRNYRSIGRVVDLIKLKLNSLLSYRNEYYFC